MSGLANLTPYPTYKPSGVEWLGDVPAHWEVGRSKRTFTPRQELASPEDVQLSATQAYGVIAQEDYEKRVGRKVVKILRHLEQRRRSGGLAKDVDRPWCKMLAGRYGAM